MKIQRGIGKKHFVNIVPWMVLQFILVSCGLGTEVGNGVKPGDDNERSGNKKSSESAGDQDSNESVSNDDMVTSPTGEKSETLEDSEVGNSTSGPAFDKDILFNSCASPFETTYAGVLVLKSTGDLLPAIHITGVLEVDTWTFKDTSSENQSNFLAKVTDNGIPEDYIVEVTDENDQAKSSGYTCSAVSGSAKGDQYTYSATLTKNTVTASLSWTVDKSAGAEKLVSITVKPSNTSPSVVTIEATNE